MSALQREHIRPVPCVGRPIGVDDLKRYRLHFLRQDVRAFVILASLGIVFNLLWSWSDYLFLRETIALPWILGIRIGLIALSLWAISVAVHSNDPSQLDRWCFCWCLACAVVSNLVTMSRPAVYTDHVVVEQLVVIALYIVQPGSILLRILPPLLLSVVGLFLFFFFKFAMGFVASLSMVTAYLSANVIGWLAATTWHRYRQDSFFTNELLEKLCHQAEAGRLAAEASERTWERIIDTSPNMLFVVNNQRRIMRVNQTFLDRLGITRRQAMGRSCCDLLCQVASSHGVSPLHDLLGDGQAHTLETRFLPLGMDCRIMTAPLLDPSGDQEATVCIVQDITNQKRMDRELQATREMYRSLVQNCHGIIYTLRPDGVITYVSPSFNQLVGYDPEVVIGKHFREIVHPDDVVTCEMYQQRILAGGDYIGGIENRVIHRDGSIRWHFSILSPCHNVAGAIEKLVGNAIDITELKQYQVELSVARETAEKANKTKSDFLAMISHEIRTPLNAIVGFGALARQTTDNRQLKEYVDIMEKSSRQLMDLVNDILDMSRAEAGQLHLDMVPFHLPEAIDLLRQQYEPLAKQKHLTFQLRLEEGIPSWILGDPLRFRQVISNLLSNAIKFTESGQVSLTAGCHPVGAPGGMQMIRFEVQDTGIGIEDSDQTLLFQPFSQLNPGTASKYGGSGLGLAIVWRLVELMQGRISLFSKIHQGTRFTVDLPLAPAMPPPFQEMDVVATGSLSILVVEDNAFNRILLRDTLRSWGHVVMATESASRALELFDPNRFDVILLDIRMPGMDGIEFTRRLRRLEQIASLEATPIIAYTADTDESTKEACLASGMAAVLFKPLDHRHLAHALGRHCGTAKAHRIPSARLEIAEAALADHILSDLDHDSKRIRTYHHLLLNDIKQELARLYQAIYENNRSGCQAAAHSLKGLCGYLQDRRPAELALELHSRSLLASFAELHNLAMRLRTAGGWTDLNM